MRLRKPCRLSRGSCPPRVFRGRVRLPCVFALCRAVSFRLGGGGRSSGGDPQISAGGGNLPKTRRGRISLPEEKSLGPPRFPRAAQPRGSPPEPSTSQKTGDERARQPGQAKTYLYFHLKKFTVNVIIHNELIYIKLADYSL